MQINPSFSGGISGVKPHNRPTSRRTRSGEEVAVPSRAELNFIPSAESIATFVQNAIAAFKQGITWDRGTILNLLV
jgi:hypothetical protein